MLCRIACLFLVLCVLPFPTSAQADNEDFLSKTFKEIIRTDQSNVNDSAKRFPVIRNNFELIKTLLADSVNLNTEKPLKKRTKKRLRVGLNITFTHILQIDPRLLMNDETSDFFAHQIEQGRICTQELKSALWAYQIDVDNNRFPKEDTDYYTERVETIRRKWNIE